MVDDVNANIGVNIDTSSALASLKVLQRQISLFHTQMAAGGAAANNQAAKLQANLLNAVSATGQFQASMTRVNSTTEAFTTALEKNKLSMGQYFRYAGGASKTFGRAFKSEFDTISKVAVERVKDLQTQYISMGRDANGALQAIKIRPLSLDMDNLATKTMIAAQKQQLFNQLLTQGSTNLLNFGKNTQWAGRQLMVGFTIPLTMFATAAAKSFMDIEKQIIKIRRVYGDFSTTVEETDQMVESIKSLAGEYTKYGIAVEKTIGLASEAAAAGKTGQELLAQVSEATRLAVLGNVEQSQALETTMSITNAFGTATEDLASKIDFLNAVENQSVTSIEDLTEAIPKAGPVVQQLGGDVEDLAFFLTAMKEGGINASEGANALKSGLAALINPTGKAKEMLQGFGINIEKIVESNKGDIKGLVIDFASALDTLDPLNRARAIEQLFGKFQFSRLSTLFQNVIGEGTQASRVLELTKATTQELAILSQRELKKVEDTTTYKFEKAFADFQAALAPVGESFLKVVTPILEFGTKLLEQFNSMGDGAKNFTIILTTVVAGIGPVLLMTVGLVANGVANLIKMFQLLGGIFRKTGADTGLLGVQTDYMTQQQIEAAAVAASLNQSHSKLTQTFSVEAAALNSLTAAYQKAVTAQRGFSGGGKVAGSSTRPKKYAGGVVSVPGPKGAGDVVPAMLSPGEAVIPAGMAKKYGGLISGMVAGNIPGYENGLVDNQKSHIQGSLDPKNPAVRAQILKLVGNIDAMDPEMQKRMSFQGSMVADLSREMNQGLRSTGKGFAPEEFVKKWNERNQKLLSTAMSGGLDPNSPDQVKALKEIEDKIGKRAGELAKTQGVVVKDAIVAQATKEIISESKKTGGTAKKVATALESRAGVIGDYRANYTKAELEKMLASGQAVVDPKRPSRIIDPNSGIEIGEIRQSSKSGRNLGVKGNSARPVRGGYRGQKVMAVAASENMTPAEKRKATIQRKAEEQVRATQAEQYKRDERNARRREQYAARKAAAVPPAPKPGIGSRIASGVKGGMARIGPMGGMMAAGAIGGGLSMIPGMEGLGAAVGIVGPLLMMLPGPVAAVVAALGAMVGVVMSTNAAVDASRKKTVEMANAVTVNNTALNKLAEDFGTVSASQSASATLEAGLFATTAEQLSAGQQMLEQSPGAQEILSDVQKRIDSNQDVKAIGENLAQTLITAILQGILSKADATTLANAIAQKVGNIDIGSTATSQISQLTGNTSMDIFNTLNAQKDTSAEFDRMVQARDAASGEGTDTQMLGRTYAATGFSGMQIGGLAMQEMNNYAQAVGMADVAIKDLSMTEEERKAALDTSLQKQQEAIDKIMKYKAEISSAEFNSQIRTQIEFMYPDDPAAQNVLSLIEGDTIPDGEFKTLVSAQFAGGQISPAMSQFLLDKAKSNKNFQSTYKMLVDTRGFQGAWSVITKTQQYAQFAAGAIRNTLTSVYQLANYVDRLQGRGTLDAAAGIPAAPSFVPEPTPETSGGGGGGGGTPEDSILKNLNEAKDKQQKALNVINLKEEAINKTYDKRKKALEDIAKLNQKIAENQKSQLTIAEALSSGDISAAARAVQDAKAKASQYAEEQQMQALEKKRQLELDGIIVNGKTKEAYEAEIAKLNLQIAERELALANSAATSGSGSGGSSASGASNPGPPAPPAPPAPTFVKKAKPTGDAGYGKAWEYLSKENDWYPKDVPKPPYAPGPGKKWGWDTVKDYWTPVSIINPPADRLASGGMVANRYMASGGSLGSDTVSAMLTPGEFVVKRPAVQKFGVKNLEAINSGKSANGSVYNYSVTVNAATGANADEIARTVISKIKQVDGQKLRGNRY